MSEAWQRPAIPPSPYKAIGRIFDMAHGLASSSLAIHKGTYVEGDGLYMYANSGANLDMARVQAWENSVIFFRTIVKWQHARMATSHPGRGNLVAVPPEAGINELHHARYLVEGLGFSLIQMTCTNPWGDSTYNEKLLIDLPDTGSPENATTSELVRLSYRGRLVPLSVSVPTTELNSIYTSFSERTAA